MGKNTHCLLGQDLLPWERRYFRAFACALNLHTPIDCREFTPPDFCPMGEGDSVWVVARDWRAFVKALPDIDGPVFVSLLNTVPTERLLGVLPRHWNPIFPRRLTLLAHSPFCFRFFREMEAVPEGSVVHLPLPAFLGSPVSTAPGGIFRVGILSAPNADANLGFLASLAHYVCRLEPSVRFVLPPMGRLTVHFKEVAADLGFLDRVDWVGDPSACMDLLLQVQLKVDHFVPVLLAGSQSIPVLASDTPGAADWIRDGHGGFVFPVNHARPAGELILRLAQNRALVSALGEKLRASLAARAPADRLVRSLAAALGVSAPVSEAAA